ncbi:MAG: efflux RND transporter periplasmic adaptor subunit [Lachnospiraceae bacterium]|nr:efflux RND transporter periplasmic adaptor subunit [Lachnospiraceae bacterium]
MKHKKIIIGTCIAVAAAVGAASVSVSAGTAIQTATVSSGQLDCELELNGKVESLDRRSYYSKIDGRISTVHVKEGDLVKAGDLLISYDTEELSMDEMLAQLDAAADQGGYDDSKQYGGRVGGLYQEAKNSLPELEQQIQTTEAVIIMTQKALTDRKSELSQRGAQLQAYLAGCVAEEGDDPKDVQKKRENIEYEIAQNSHDQQYDPEIVKRQDELQFLNYLMTSYKEKKSVMESQKAQTQLNLQTQGARDRLEAEKAADDLVNESRLKDLAVASEGIKAEFSGVVTKLSVTEGCSVKEGQELIEIQSIDDVAVVCAVNKYDIINIEEGQTASAHIKNKDYECRVTRIEKKTSEDAATPGIRVELKLTEPDDSIILGLESKTKIRTAMLAYALLVPMDALCSDEDGDYVFVIEDGKAVKRSVVTGVRNDDMAEIIEGITAGETVGWDEMSELTDGQKVKVK